MPKESTSWIDIVNEDVFPNMFNARLGKIDRKSEYYQAGLDIVKTYIASRSYNVRMTHAKMLPSRQYFFLDEHRSDFARYFKRHFRLHVKQDDFYFDRPSGMKDSDECLDGNFYDALDGYNELSPGEIRQFYEEKDEIHERYYGHIKRFGRLSNDHAHGVISADPFLRRRFIAELKHAIDGIVNARVENSDGARHFRKFVKD